MADKSEFLTQKLIFRYKTKHHGLLGRYHDEDNQGYHNVW